ncbi:peptidase domain-containing ABC transporter [Candidatus Accumulibacter phosphatis]|uniref:Cyclolysin secretion ATP-binding protein n=1 Tax=Candidatus Accumulibacter phosphatis TaxID=327160 RepID=A0A5S4ETJ1_9PROT|nr:peptidase domain-containing ABC transporter [Candidatus Accumulibacter phosphatis]TMQ78704.1 cyclolysin secretion ATP-binding protein [Candidatus Accumulibacter phosphatis]
MASAQEVVARQGDEPNAGQSAQSTREVLHLPSFHRLPFDASLIEQEFPPPYTLATFQEAARSLGLNTGKVALAGVDWQKLPLPAIAFLRPQPVAPEPIKRPPLLILILKADADKLLYFRTGSQTPETLPIAEATQWLEPELILVAKTRRATGEEDIAGFTAEKKAFGFKWFIPELLKHKSLWRDVLTASLAIQLVGLATPLFTQVIIDKVIVHQTQSTLIVLGVALVMFMLFTSGMTWLRQYLVLHTGNRIDAVLGSQVFRHLLRLPLPYFEQRPTGTLVARLQGVETIREFVSGAAVTLLLDLPFLFIFLAVMFAYSGQLSLIAVGLLGAIAFISFLVAPLFREKLDQQFMLGARNQAFLTEYVSGMATVKSLQMEPDIDKKYGDYLAQYLAAGFSTKQVGNTYHVIANGLEQGMTLAILIAGALLVMENEGFTIGMLVAFQMFAGRMSQPLLRIAGLWQEFQQANIAVKRLGDILDMPREPYTLTPHREQAGVNKRSCLLTIDQLSFRYSGHHPWLFQKLELAFKPGHLTVVTGPSGCGKSTLAKLMLGFYPPTEGHIALDGKDTRHLAANELRATFGVVPQETVLFSGTLYDNLVMAHPHARFEDVILACKAAEIHEVIEQLPNGYQTEIGERGTGLSGGQRQRLAIARALLKRPQILIFDEAVSNLDQQTAEHFAKTINRLKGMVTMIFITHQIPRGLAVDEVFSFSAERQQATRMGVVEEERK